MGLALLLGNSSMAFAQEASPGADTTKKLRERIERVVDEKRDQVQGTVDDLSNKRRGFVGEVQRVTEGAITVKNHKGTQILPIGEETTLVKAGKTIGIDTVAVGDWAIVIGVIEDDAFSARRIIVSSESLRPRTHAVALGSITNRTTKELTILSRNGETLTFMVNTKTSYQDRDGEKAKADQFIKDMQVLVVGYEGTEGKVATTVRTIVPLDLMEDNE